MRSITALSIANDAIRAAVIADPYSDLPTIKHFQAIPLPNGAVVDGEVVDHDVVAGLLNTLVKRFKFPARTRLSSTPADAWCFARRTFLHVAERSEIHLAFPSQRHDSAAY
ncbi:MAG: hypothetical protein ACLSUZ_00850 [Bifidobacterium pseudocatenulatum]